MKSAPIVIRATRLHVRSDPAGIAESGVELQAHGPGPRLLATTWIDLSAQVADLHERAQATLGGGSREE